MLSEFYEEKFRSPPASAEWHEEQDNEDDLGPDVELDEDRQWAIFQSSAVQGVGITEGLDWLVSVLASL
jgi:hypothetical protein